MSQFETLRLPVVFQKVPMLVTKTLGGGHPGVPITQAIEIDKDWEMLTMGEKSDSCYSICELLQLGTAC